MGKHSLEGPGLWLETVPYILSINRTDVENLVCKQFNSLYKLFS